jgi:hypothetical protein
MVATSTLPRGTLTLSSVASFLLAATSIKEILIGTTHSGISYQSKQISGFFFFKTTFWWGKGVYIFFYEISDFPEPSEQFFFNLIIQSNEMQKLEAKGSI